MKLCKDCKHYISGGWFSLPTCRAAPIYTDYVKTGKSVYMSCADCRDRPLSCGKSAKYFHPK